MKVLFCASEVNPFAKTGGLADVAGSLPLALGELGIEVMIAMPRYRGLKGGKKKLSKHVSIFFVEHEAFFNRASLYGNEHGDYPDNLQRFSYFCNQALFLAKGMGFRPDVVHANDWQTALLPVLIKKKLSSDPFFKKTKTLLTIHNMAYQGIFPHRLYGDLGLDERLFSVDGFEFFGKINFLKAGLIFADALSTVSPTYAKEIQTSACGYWLEGVVQKRKSRLRGILNGIDTKFWDPEKDRRIKSRYSAGYMKGKAICRADLKALCDFKRDPEVPVFGMVTRLAQQKGLDLFSEASDAFLSKKLQFVLLGEGDRVYHTAFGNIGKRNPQNSKIYLGFNAESAHRIYAGCDFFLMPSLYEPCGLGQMISLRYGTLPLARKTGGLADTVVDCDRNAKNGNGFLFEDHNPRRFLEAVDRALSVFQDKKRLAALRQHGMRVDFSWEKSAKEYKRYYKEIINK